MSLPVVKAIVAMVVLAAGLAGASLPWMLRARLPSERVIAWGDTFAGGVLGGAGLIHLLGGGIDGFRTYVPQLHYPVALLLAGIGFLLILLIEAVIVGERSTVHEWHAHHSHTAGHEVGYGRPSERPGHYAYVLLLVLSVHSLIVGVALGAQESVYGVFVIFFAILAHKTVAGFALGVGYSRSGIPWHRGLSSIALFSAMTPVGIFLGTAVGSLISTHNAHIFTAVFDSIGAGTFLYISALDIIRTEFSSPDDRLVKWLSTCFGFGIMAILALWI